jgi:hypothetical protein
MKKIHKDKNKIRKLKDDTQNKKRKIPGRFKKRQTAE